MGKRCIVFNEVKSKVSKPKRLHQSERQSEVHGPDRKPRHGIGLVKEVQGSLCSSASLCVDSFWGELRAFVRSYEERLTLMNDYVQPV
jgi:hypothetical protein